MFDLKVEIYKKLALKEDLKFEKSTGGTVKLKNQKDNLSETSEKEVIEYTEDKSKGINSELFERHFKKKLFETKDKNKNNISLNVINSGLCDLKDEIKKMSKEEIEIENPDKILTIVEEILEFNKKN